MGTQQDLGHLAGYILRKRVVFCKKTFYLCLEENIWCEVERVVLCDILLTELVAVIDKAIDVLREAGMEDKDLENLTKKKGQIKNYNTASCLLGLASASIWDARFTDKLDCNWDIIPFKNGVFDLVANTFRPLTPEDRLTRTLEYEYDPNVVCEELDDFLEKALPEKSR